MPGHLLCRTGVRGQLCAGRRYIRPQVASKGLGCKPRLGRSCDRRCGERPTPRSWPRKPVTPSLGLVPAAQLTVEWGTDEEAVDHEPLEHPAARAPNTSITSTAMSWPDVKTVNALIASHRSCLRCRQSPQRPLAARRFYSLLQIQVKRGRRARELNAIAAMSPTGRMPLLSSFPSRGAAPCLGLTVNRDDGAPGTTDLNVRRHDAARGWSG